MPAPEPPARAARPGSRPEPADARRPARRRCRRTRARGRSDRAARLPDADRGDRLRRCLSTTYAALLAGHGALRPPPRADPRRRDPRARGRHLHALEADRPREGRDVDPPAVRGGAPGRRQAPARAPAALRRRRAADLHALHGRLDRARARRPAAARARDRPHRERRCSRPRPATTSCTPAFTWLCARATAQERETERAAPAGRRRTARPPSVATIASAASRSSASVNSSAVRVRSSTRRTAGGTPGEHEPRPVARQLGARAQELLEHRRVDERGAREVEDDAAAAGRLVDVRAQRRASRRCRARRRARAARRRPGRRRPPRVGARGVDARAVDLRFVQAVSLVHPSRCSLLGGHGDNVARRRAPLPQIMSCSEPRWPNIRWAFNACQPPG